MLVRNYTTQCSHRQFTNYYNKVIDMCFAYQKTDLQFSRTFSSRIKYSFCCLLHRESLDLFDLVFMQLSLPLKYIHLTYFSTTPSNILNHCHSRHLTICLRNKVWLSFFSCRGCIANLCVQCALSIAIESLLYATSCSKYVVHFQ